MSRSALAAPNTNACPCGTGRPLDTCCGPYLGGTAQVPTAEALMRSRYTAFTRCDESYLLATWHASTRPAALQFAGGTATRDNATRDTTIKWIGLDVKRAASTGDNSAVVEFAARFKTGGRAQRMHEVSRFVCEDGRWYYVNAQEPSP